MKKFFLWLAKAFAAGCIAFSILCAFCMLYYNVPVHYANPSGATDYIWESHKFYSKGTEGFALGRTNNEGLNNLKDYHKGDRIDVLFMGSSHMEGFNVAQDENACAVLNELFAGQKYSYNIGTAGHDLMTCISNLPAALDYYRPTEYVVLESFSIDFDQQTLHELTEGKLADIPSHSGGIIGLLQKLPYLRLFYTQHFKGGGEAFGDTQNAPITTEEFDYAEALSPVLDMVAESCSKYGVQPIIVFNSSLFLNEQGDAYTAYDTDKFKVFSDLCQEKGIELINMSDAFLKEFALSTRLPYGFANTSPGGGHMNKLGHELFAREVWLKIQEMEG